MPKKKKTKGVVAPNQADSQAAPKTGRAHKKKPAAQQEAAGPPAQQPPPPRAPAYPYETQLGKYITVIQNADKVSAKLETPGWEVGTTRWTISPQLDHVSHDNTRGLRCSRISECLVIHVVEIKSDFSRHDAQGTSGYDFEGKRCSLDGYQKIVDWIFANTDNAKIDGMSITSFPSDFWLACGPSKPPKYPSLKPERKLLEAAPRDLSALAPARGS